MVGEQESRLAMACAKQFKAACTTILQNMRTRSCHDPSDLSVGAQLLKVVDPETGQFSFLAWAMRLSLHLIESDWPSALFVQDPNSQMHNSLQK